MSIAVPPDTRAAESPSPARAESPAGLDRRIDFPYFETELDRAVFRIVGKGRYIVTFDHRAMRENFQGVGDPVDGEFRNIRASAALTKLLKPLFLTWRLEGREITVTPITGNLLKVYDLRAAAGREDGPRLVKSVLALAPEHFRETSGYGPYAGTMMFRDGILQLRHDLENEIPFDLFVRTLRKCSNIKAVPQKLAKPVSYVTPLDVPRDVFSKLSRPVAVSVREVRTIDVVREIANQAGLNVRIDEKLSAEYRESLDLPCSLERVSTAESAFEQLLENRGYGLTFRDGKLLVSSDSEIDKSAISVVVDAREFVGNGVSAAALADLVTDAVDVYDWQRMDGIGGTVESPTQNTLVVRHQLHAVFAVLKYLDSLRAMIGKTPLSASLIQHRLASRVSRKVLAKSGLGRLAGYADWGHFPKEQQHMIRAQMDRLPPVDEVKIYGFFPGKHEKAETEKVFQLGSYRSRIQEVRTFTGKPAKRLASLWRRQSFSSGHEPLLPDEVHIPRYGLEFRHGGKIVMRNSISWFTNTLLLRTAPGKYERHEFNKRTKPARDLLRTLTRLLPQPSFEAYAKQAAEEEEKRKADKKASAAGQPAVKP